MTIVNRIRAIAGISVLVAALAIGYQIFDPGRATQTRDYTDRVRLVAEYSSTSEAETTYQVGPESPQTQPLRGTAWQKTVRAAHGDRILFMITAHRGGFVECFMFHGEHEVDRQEMDGPGTISCQYVVP